MVKKGQIYQNYIHSFVFRVFSAGAIPIKEAIPPRRGFSVVQGCALKGLPKAYNFKTSICICIMYIYLYTGTYCIYNIPMQFCKKNWLEFNLFKYSLYGSLLSVAPDITLCYLEHHI